MGRVVAGSSRQSLSVGETDEGNSNGIEGIGLAANFMAGFAGTDPGMFRSGNVRPFCWG